jgi:hypothetical protein
MRQITAKLQARFVFVRRITERRKQIT